MMPLEFATTPRIIVQAGAMTQVSPWHQAYAGQRIFLMTDAGLIRAGLVTPVVDALTQAGCQVTIYSDVQVDPPQAHIEQAVQAAMDAQAQVIIGLGGGSAMDTAKLVALLVKTPQRLEDIFGIGLATGTRLPLILVPTTAGTGSEVTPISIVTTPSDEKKGVVSALLYPDLAILDAQLTLGLPPNITAMTGIDAMVHAIEAFTSKHKKNPISDGLAKEALALMYHNLPLVLADGQNVAARAAMMTGSLMAGMAFANAPVAAVHALAYPLGGQFHVPHGLSNALVLAPILQYNLEAATPAYAQLAQVIAPQMVFDSPAVAASWFVERMAVLVQQMPFAQTLREVGVTEADLDSLADDAMKVERLLINNPRVMTHAAARAIYARQLG